MLSARILVSSLALLASVAACGEPPQPVAANSTPAAAAPHAGQPLPQPVPASFEGRVLLQGELAGKDGFLMISACPKGSALPLMSYKIALTDAPPARGDERIVPFRLDTSNDLMGGGGLPHDATGMELELSVRFDVDGMVESKEGDVTVAVPVQPDATGIEVALGG